MQRRPARRRFACRQSGVQRIRLPAAALPNDDIYFYSKKIDNSRLVRQADPGARGECWSRGGSGGRPADAGRQYHRAARRLRSRRLQAGGAEEERQALLDQKRDLEVQGSGPAESGAAERSGAGAQPASPAADQIIHLDTLASTEALRSAIRPAGASTTERSIRSCSRGSLGADHIALAKSAVERRKRSTCSGLVASAKSSAVNV